MSCRILVLNVNTNTAITERLVAQARLVAKADTSIDVLQPAWGVSSVESAYDAYISVVAGLDRIHAVLGAGVAPTNVPWDAMIWGGFGDPGSEAFEDLLGIPVVDLARSAALDAFERFGNYAVISTVARMTPLIRRQLGEGEVGRACLGIYTVELPVTTVGATDGHRMVELLAPLARHARDEGANSICLGSGALVGLAEMLADEIRCPVIDGITAAVRLAEAVGTRVSPAGTASIPLAVKSRPGWPIS